MSTGTTVQVIGAVVDVEFPAGQIPKIYDALIIDEPGITLEVQQQLGDGVVRTIAMGSSEGLKRGMDVTNNLTRTSPTADFRLSSIARMATEGPPASESCTSTTTVSPSMTRSTWPVKEWASRAGGGYPEHAEGEEDGSAPAVRHHRCQLPDLTEGERIW